MTELSFLIELLLNHDLPKATKDLIASRIKEVESKLVGPNPTIRDYHTVQMPNHMPKQVPSTLALMAKHGDIPPVAMQAPSAPVPVEVIAQTPQAQAAMQSRQEAISMALSGKVDKVAGRPRKF